MATEPMTPRTGSTFHNLAAHMRKIKQVHEVPARNIHLDIMWYGDTQPAVQARRRGIAIGTVLEYKIDYEYLSGERMHPYDQAHQILVINRYEEPDRVPADVRAIVTAQIPDWEPRRRHRRIEVAALPDTVGPAELTALIKQALAAITADADARLRPGECKSAVRNLQRAPTVPPSSKPRHWERHGGR